MYSIVAVTDASAGPFAVADGPKRSPLGGDEFVTWASAPEAIKAIVATQRINLAITGTSPKFGHRSD
jgi:hypothetical protein